MKIAILHDDFSITGGGEKLIGLMAKELNNNGFKTDIITRNLSGETLKIIPNNLNIIDLNEKSKEQDSRILFKRLELKGYDFYIFSGHNCIYAAKDHKPNMLYNHNIPYSEFKSESSKVNKSKEWLDSHDLNQRLELMGNPLIERIWNRILTFKKRFIKKNLPNSIAYKIDRARYLISKQTPIKDNLQLSTHYQNISQIQKIIVNSKNIKTKVKKAYNRDSIVIYPPIETSKYKNKNNKDYWISINRITPLKRIELQIEAFSKLPNQNLKVIGNIEDENYYESLKKKKPRNVIFLGTISEEKLIKELSECRGLLFTAKDEDFGMAVVEAMASGKPVIAPNEGGCKETIIENKTGYLIDNIDKDKIVQKIELINKKLASNPNQYIDLCKKQAKEFDISKFSKNIIKEINLMANNRSSYSGFKLKPSNKSPISQRSPF